MVSPKLTPAQLSIQNRIKAYRMLAAVPDLSAHTKPARDAFDKRFEREADPEGRLSPEERQRRAAFLRRAYFQELALRSSQARRKRAAA